MEMKYKNPALSPEERADDLLRRLNIDEKMAQVNCIFPFGEGYEDYEKLEQEMPFGIGQVSTLEMRRIETLEEAAEWQRNVQKIVMRNSSHGIPAIFHMEGLCGAFIQEAASFPSGIARGSSFDPQLEEKIGKIVSRQEAACGITHIFAPVLDISRDSRMGRQGETYGEDPTLAAAMGSAYTKGIQSSETAGRRTESVAKHFLAFHNSQGGIHGTHSDTPPRLLEEVYGKPFQAAIRMAGLKGIMPCYCSIDGEPASASYDLLTKLLREKMGFDGLCVSDYGAVGNVHRVQHIGETEAEAGLLCMEAGMDMELPGTTGYNEKLKYMFETGEAEIAVLDQAVRRVLEAKFRMGLFENPYALQGEALRQIFYDVEDKNVLEQSARESMVLLKNNGLLPIIGKVKKLAVIGPHAAYAGKFFGGYTHLCMMESTYAAANSIAGVSGVVQKNPEEIQTVPGTHIQSDETEEILSVLRRQKPECKSLLEELKERLPETEILYAYGYPIAGEDQSGFQEALRAVEEADLVLLTLGGKHGTCSMASMGEGVDSTNINLPLCQDIFIKEAASRKKPMIGIHFDGRPISSNFADQYLDAILEAWNPAEAGAKAVVDTLLGVYDPGGKLPLSVAYSAGQIPIYYNHPNGSAWHQGESIGFVNYVDLPHTPRYCFGHGLSYTKFEYSDLEISEQTIQASDAIKIACNIKNTGNYRGDEVVQLYLIDEYASRTRPVKELAGFCRLTLEPGEIKRVLFEAEASQMAFLDRNMEWKVEKGTIWIEIGSSSEDIRLTGVYKVQDDIWIEGKDRAFWANVSIRQPEENTVDQKKLWQSRKIKQVREMW